MTAWLQAFACVVCAASGPTGQIAFVAGTSETDQRVSVLDIASGNVTPVGFGQYDANPAWSFDGEWLAFSTREDKGLSIGIVRKDGSEKRLLPHQFPWNRYPVWAPDKMRLMYVADQGNVFEAQCVVYDVEKGSETIWGGGAKSVLRPVWMPNRNLLTTLVMLSEGKLAIDLNQIDQLGNAISPIGSLESNKLSLSFGFVTADTVLPAPAQVMPSPGSYVIWGVTPSPKGTSIAFESNDGGDREIFVFAKRGSADVTNHRASDWNPVWSPDSQWIAFESLRDNHRGIYRVFPDTARTLPVTSISDGDCWSPAWSPDGKWIAYVSDRSGECQLYAVSVSDRNETIQLTKAGSNHYAPVWRPAPKKGGRR